MIVGSSRLTRVSTGVGAGVEMLDVGVSSIGVAGEADVSGV
jgi:hypothetical protein